MGDVAGGPIGIVCGLASEAAALGKDAPFLIGVSGARPEKAATEADRLIAAGVRVLISFGLAGALDPMLRPGDLVIPATIIAEGGETYEVDPAWLEALDLETSSGADRLLGTETIISTAAAKAALYAEYDAAAVDMESHRVAERARSAGLPFIAIRAIADPAKRALPAIASSAVKPDGQIDFGATLRGLIAAPWQLPMLIQLGGESAAGTAQLREMGKSLRVVA